MTQLVSESAIAKSPVVESMIVYLQPGDTFDLQQSRVEVGSGGLITSLKISNAQPDKTDPAVGSIKRTGEYYYGKRYEKGPSEFTFTVYVEEDTGRLYYDASFGY